MPPPETPPTGQPDTSLSAPEPIRTEETAVSAARQTEEVQLVASNLIQSRGIQLEAMNSQERNAAFAADQGDAAISSLYTLNEASDNQDFTSESNPKGMPTWNEKNPDDKPIKVRVHGVDTTLFYISSFDGENFYGSVEGETPGSMVTSPPIPKAEVLRGQLLSCSESLLNSKSITEEGKAVLKMYIDLARNGEKGIVNLGSEQVNEAIIMTAQSANIITSDHARALVDKQFPESANNPKRAELLKIIEGTNILTYEQFMTVAKATGVDTDISKLLPDIIKQEQSLMRAGDMPNLTPEQQLSLSRQLNDVQKARARLEQIQKLMEGKGESEIEAKFKESFNAIQEGRDPQRAKLMREALETGDPLAILTALFPAKPGETEEDKKAREQLLAQLRGGGIFLAIITWLVDEGVKSQISK